MKLFGKEFNKDELLKNTVEEKDLSVRTFFSGNLNNFIHWGSLALGTIVLGFEPANTTIGRRAVERKNGDVPILHPHESVSYAIKFSFSRG